MALSKEEIEFAKAYKECFNKAVNSITNCFHPECPNKSINSHILQKNGILSSIAPSRHLMWHGVDHFQEGMMKFIKTGINDAYSFNCFCSEHDSELFKPIEQGVIDFDNYRNMLLFTIRTLYNEKFRKLVNIKLYELLVQSHPERYDTMQRKVMNDTRESEKLGLIDLEKTEKVIWDDFYNHTESFNFQHKFMPIQEICMSAFFNYETTYEFQDYLKEHGQHMPESSDIFVNFFPYQGKSVYSMGYEKKNEMKLKPYVNSYFKESEKKLERKISNLLLFRCETWVCSEKLYNQRFKKFEKFFAEAAHFSVGNYNERVNYNLNLFRGDFIKQFNDWKSHVKNL